MGPGEDTLTEKAKTEFREEIKNCSDLVLVFMRIAITKEERSRVEQRRTPEARKR